MGVAVTVATYVQDNRTPLVTATGDVSVLENSSKNGSCPPAALSLSTTDVEDSRVSNDVWVWLGAGLGCHTFVAWNMFGGEGGGALARWVELNNGMDSRIFL